jgi:hypothetical protein
VLPGELPNPPVSPFLIIGIVVLTISVLGISIWVLRNRRASNRS